jgi:hypothetical protein
MQHEDRLFLEAAGTWDLETIYTKLAQAKQVSNIRDTKLSSIEKAILRGLLCGCSPKKIAAQLNWTSGSLNVQLSKGLYRYVEAITDRELNTIRNWRDVASWLEQAEYKISQSKQDWREAPIVSSFYGREEELKQLENWIVKDKYQLVTLYGMAGIGKTTLAIKLAQKIQGDFDYVIWRNLHYQPKLEQILPELITFVAESSAQVATTIEKQISQLMDYLSSSRCLIIFDGLEAILKNNYYAGAIEDKYNEYFNFFNIFATVKHQSCLLLISQDEPDKMIFWQDYQVGSLHVKGLGESAKGILSENFTASSETWNILIKRYKGHPLALKLVGVIIKELFNGNVLKFLNTKTELDVIVPMFFNEVLKQQFQRLSDLEIKIICAIAMAKHLKHLEDLQQEIAPPIYLSDLTLALLSLKKRSLIEIITISDKAAFTISPIIKKFILREYQSNCNTILLN